MDVCKDVLYEIILELRVSVHMYVMSVLGRKETRVDFFFAKCSNPIVKYTILSPGVSLDERLSVS